MDNSPMFCNDVATNFNMLLHLEDMKNDIEEKIKRKFSDIKDLEVKICIGSNGNPMSVGLFYDDKSVDTKEVQKFVNNNF